MLDYPTVDDYERVDPSSYVERDKSELDRTEGSKVESIYFHLQSNTFPNGYGPPQIRDKMMF